jgi:hypothetical protein
LQRPCLPLLTIVKESQKNFAEPISAKAFPD